MDKPLDEKALTHEIAQLLDHPSVFMDGPSQQNTRKAKAIVYLVKKHLEATQAGESEAVNDTLAAEAELRIVRKERDALQAENERLRAFRNAAYGLAGPRPKTPETDPSLEPTWSVDLFEVERRAALADQKGGA